MSYETAIAGNNLKLAPGTKDAPDLTDAELAGPMRDGSFLDACGVPTSTHVTVITIARTGLPQPKYLQAYHAIAIKSSVSGR